MARFWNRLKRIQERRARQAEVDEKRWRLEQLNLNRGVYFGLQANQELPMTSQEQKKKPNDGKIREVKNQMLRFIEEYQQALSHPWYYEEYMGLAHVFDAPPGAVSKHVKGAGNAPGEPEDVSTRAKRVEQSIVDKLQRIIDHTESKPISEMAAEEPIGEVSEN